LRSFETQSDEAPVAEGTRRAYLNLGEKATTVMFAENQRILFLKYVSIGGYHLDRAVANHLDLDLAQAARMRARVSSSQELDVEDEIHRSVIDSIRDPLEAIGSEIELCLRYDKVTFRGRGLEKMIITGDNASPWLIEYFAQRLGTPCEMGDPFGALAHRPTAPASLDRPWRWTTAMGLSLKN
jgi:type IV pilus assembly protein PilM